MARVQHTEGEQSQELGGKVAGVRHTEGKQSQGSLGLLHLFLKTKHCSFKQTTDKVVDIGPVMSFPSSDPARQSCHTVKIFIFMCRTLTCLFFPRAKPGCPCGCQGRVRRLCPEDKSHPTILSQWWGPQSSPVRQDGFRDARAALKLIQYPALLWAVGQGTMKCHS